MADDPDPMARLLVESQREAGKPRVMPEGPRMHADGGRLAQDPPPAGRGAVAEVREHEPGHVGRTGAHRARRGRAVHDLELLDVEPPAAPRIAVGDARRELR